ncbi:MAG: T9SS type A sorting domain-containing protein [Saprospiraceae bacterium]
MEIMKSSYWMMLVILHLSTTNLFSQTVPPTPMSSSATNHGGRGQDGQELPRPVDRGCKLTMEFEVLLSNLEDFSPNPSTIIPNQVYQLPTNYPLMYIEMNVGGIISIQPVTQFYFKEEAYLESNPGFAGDPGTSNGIYGPGYYTNVFSAVFSLTIDVFETCEDEGYNLFSVPASMHLLTPDDNPLTQNNNNSANYFPYPMCDHMIPVDIFSCWAFPDYCEIASPCNDGAYNSTNGTISARCNPNYCTATVISERIKDIESPETSINPNPFQGNLDINWSNDSGQLQTLEIIDLNGRTVLYQNGFSFGSQEISLETARLEKGVYFLKLSSNQKTEVFKLVKQ